MVVGIEIKKWKTLIPGKIKKDSLHQTLSLDRITHEFFLVEKLQ